VHVACPQCGTGYHLAPETLERARLRLRCRRCRHVWDPRHPLGEHGPMPADAVAAGEETALVGAVADALEDGGADDAAAAAGEEVAPAGAATAAPRPPRWRLAAMLYTLAGLLVLASGAGFGWAYRDALPFLAAPLPALTEVQPAWRGDAQGRRLVVSAQVENPGDATMEIRRVRVKFLSVQGAWIDETVVEVPAVTVPAGGTSQLEMAVDRLPEGTASLELSVVPDAPVS
jgi:predicted Zn finger-like uncharacterized protein